MKTLKVQLHIHSKSDKEDFVPNDEKRIINRAAALGFDVISFTCHDSFVFNEELKKYALSKNILLIPGIEKRIESCHVLILNADKKSEKINSFEDLAKYKKTHHNILVIAPHMFYPEILRPFQKHWRKIIKNIDLFDALEYSHFYTKYINPFNKKAEMLAKKLNLPLLGTSDVHILKYFDKTYAEIYADKEWLSIKNAIKNKKIALKTAPLRFFEAAAAYLYMFTVIAVGGKLRKLLLRQRGSY